MMENLVFKTFLEYGALGLLIIILSYAVKMLFHKNNKLDEQVKKELNERIDKLEEKLNSKETESRQLNDKLIEVYKDVGEKYREFSERFSFIVKQNTVMIKELINKI